MNSDGVLARWRRRKVVSSSHIYDVELEVEGRSPGEVRLRGVPSILGRTERALQAYRRCCREYETDLGVDAAIRASAERHTDDGRAMARVWKRAQWDSVSMPEPSSAAWRSAAAARSQPSAGIDPQGAVQFV